MTSTITYRLYDETAEPSPMYIHDLSRPYVLVWFSNHSPARANLIGRYSSKTYAQRKLRARKRAAQ